MWAGGAGPGSGEALQSTGVLFSEDTLPPGLLPFLNMSSAIWEDNRASPNITGQMGWSAPETVKPAAAILLRNLGTQLSVTGSGRPRGQEKRPRIYAT